MLTRNKKSKELLYQAPEYKQFLILRLLNLIIIGILLLSTFYVLWFVHNNVYNAIGQAEIIISTKDNAITEVIDFDKYEKIKKNWTAKTSPIKLDNLNDPFNRIEDESTKEE